LCRNCAVITCEARAGRVRKSTRTLQVTD
jgi:hypothetical protein